MNIFEEFKNLCENVGWDCAIDFIKENKKLIEIYSVKILVDLYDSGYKVMINNDIDGGECYERRCTAINALLYFLENLI